MWAFGTSPYGLALTEERLWGMCQREFDALKRQFDAAQERQMLLLATLRADLHNTSARQFDRVFDPEDFIPGHEAKIEARVAELVAAGYNPAAAAAIATSRKSKEHNLFIINGMKGGKKGARRQRLA